MQRCPRQRLRVLAGILAGLAGLALAAPPILAQQIERSAMTLQAGYTGCAATGWKVTMRASGLAPGQVDGSPLAASNVRLTPVGEITAVGGQSDRLPSALAISSAMPLDAARQVMTAAPNAGLGVYTGAIDLQLVIPAYTARDSYTTVATVPIATGP